MDWTKDSIGNNERGPQLKDLVQILELTDEFKEVRMIGPTRRVAWHYLPVFKADGTPVMNKWKQQTRIPKMCLAYDGVKGELDPEKKCPYCEMKDADSSSYKVEAHTNVIDREAQENAPEKKGKRSDAEKKKRSLLGEKFYLKDGKKSSAYTPARYFVIKSSVGSKISDMASLNKKKIKGESRKFGPNHPRFGFDINVKYDESKKNPSEKYGCVKADNTELSEEELDILLWDLNVLQPEEYKIAKKEAESFDKRIAKGNKSGGSDDEDEEETRRTKKKSKGKAEEEDWGDDEDLEDDDEDDKKSKKKKSSKSKKSDDDDDDDWSEDDDSDDDDEDDEPKSKKKKTTKKRRDDDDDEDDDDDDDEDDVKSKSKKSSKKSRRDDDEDDDDEEEERSSKKKKSRKADDDDDDDDEDEDDEDDEPKRKKSSKSSKSSKSKKSRDDDDDDEDDDDDDGWDDD